MKYTQRKAKTGHKYHYSICTTTVEHHFTTVNHLDLQPQARASSPPDSAAAVARSFQRQEDDRSLSDDLTLSVAGASTAAAAADARISVAASCAKSCFGLPARNYPICCGSRIQVAAEDDVWGLFRPKA